MWKIREDSQEYFLKALFHDSQNTWDKNICYIQNYLNYYTYNEALGNSPFSIMFNHQPNCELSNYWDLHGILEENLSQEEIEQKLKNVQSFQRKAYLKKMLSRGDIRKKKQDTLLK